MSNKELRIKIPRDPHHSTKSLWNVVRRCNGSRRKMVDYIASIGGYSSRDGSYPIEFDISADLAHLDADTLWKHVLESEFEVEKMPPAKQVVAERLFRKAVQTHERSLWDWATEEAYEGWKDSDMPYETFTGERVSWDWVVLGRGGKHLCMTHCNGYTMTGSAEDLQDALMQRERSWPSSSGAYIVPYETIRRLFIICAQNAHEFTPTNIGREVEYRAAWRVWVSFVQDDLEAAMVQHEQRQGFADDARAILELLKNSEATDNTPAEYALSFEAICELAGININD